MSTEQVSRVPDLSSLKIDDRSRNSGRTGKRLSLFAAGLGAVVLLAGFVFAFKGQKPAVEVGIARGAGNSNAPALLNASGYVTPRRRSTVAAKITGRVTAVFAEEGIRVKAGQVLATLDNADARTRLESARADRDATAASIADLEVNLANAERELRRARELQASGVQSVQALDQARTTADSLRARIALAREQVRAADARINVAQQDLENTTVRAPFDGLVVSKDAQVGEMVSPISAGGGFTRTGIATIVDMQSLEIEVDVNESYIARVKPGQKVVATLDAYPNWQIPAKVRTIIPTADRQRFHWKYLEERSQFKGYVGWYTVRVANPDQSAQVAKAIDQEFANSPWETKTDTEKAFAASWVKQMGNIEFLILSIGGVVFFTLLLVTGNTMAIVVRERIGELAILKAVGYSDTFVLLLVLAESLLVAAVGGGLGLVLAKLFTLGGDPTHGLLPYFYLPPAAMVSGVTVALTVGVIAGILPALSAMRLRVVDALRRV